VIKGTRVPVHHVAASFEAGVPICDILRDYPSLKEERQVELALVYARAFPAPKRPKRAFIDSELVKVVKRKRLSIADYGINKATRCNHKRAVWLRTGSCSSTVGTGELQSS
jgi:hypothetical protein